MITINTNMRAVQERKRRMVAGLITVHEGRYAAAGVDLIMGSARFVGPRTVAVYRGDAVVRTVAGERVFLNLGTRASMPDLPGLADAGAMTHVEALELERLPGCRRRCSVVYCATRSSRIRLLPKAWPRCSRTCPGTDDARAEARK